MPDAFEALADAGATVRGETTFTLDTADATVAVGARDDAGTASDAAARVLGTPHVLAQFEAAVRAALRDRLPEGTHAVARSASVSHLAPVGVGESVDASATLVGVDRPDLSFACRAERGDGASVATGDLTFRVVDRDAFGERVDGR